MNLALFVFQFRSLIPSNSLEDLSLCTLVSYLSVIPFPFHDDALCLFAVICSTSFII